MARAEFDTSVVVYHGPGTATPGVVKRIILARVVSCAKITITTLPFIQREYYLTYIGAELLAGDVALAPPVSTIDQSLADTVDVFSLGLLGYTVMFNERVVPGHGRVPYRRSHIGLP